MYILTESLNVRDGLDPKIYILALTEEKISFENFFVYVE